MSLSSDLLNAWVYALAVQKWTDLAVVFDKHDMAHVECGEKSTGNVSAGWDCLFQPMPHLCTFSSDVVR